MSLETKPILTAFERSPDEGRGLARDMRVRWALEEVGQSYVARAEARPAFRRAFNAQLAFFNSAPTGLAMPGEMTRFQQQRRN